MRYPNISRPETAHGSSYTLSPLVIWLTGWLAGWLARFLRYSLEFFLFFSLRLALAARWFLLARGTRCVAT